MTLAHVQTSLLRYAPSHTHTHTLTRTQTRTRGSQPLAGPRIGTHSHPNLHTCTTVFEGRAHALCSLRHMHPPLSYTGSAHSHP